VERGRLRVGLIVSIYRQLEHVVGRLLDVLLALVLFYQSLNTVFIFGLGFLHSFPSFKHGANYGALLHREFLTPEWLSCMRLFEPSLPFFGCLFLGFLLERSRFRR
jgi:hypothetical protein